MKMLSSTFAVLGLVLAGCDASNRGNDPSALELKTDRDSIGKSAEESKSEQRERSRSVSILQTHVEEFGRTLEFARTEIWGDGSSTGARLSTAADTLREMKAELESLSSILNSAIPGKNRRTQNVAREYSNICRSLAVLQSHVKSLEGTLELARTETWGSGSSTATRLSTATQTLREVEVELDGLSAVLLAATRPGDRNTHFR